LEVFQQLLNSRHSKEGSEMSNELIQVPRRLIEELVGYLDRAGEPMVSVPGNGEWTESMVRTLKTELAKYPGAFAVADHAARNAGTLVALKDVAQWARTSTQTSSWWSGRPAL
jgi:hypothetical protein